MDHRGFDALARSFAAPKTRRGVLGGLVAFAATALGGSAQSDCPIPGQTRNRRGECSCPAGTDPCPDGCFDLKRDPRSCGGCGRTCLGGQCVKGECRCPAGTALCNGACRSQASYAADAQNCGGCGVTCATGICADGACVDNPAPGCAGAACDTFEACGPGGSCVCASLSGGGGLCSDGQTPCAGLADCDSAGACPAGFVCAVNTCCFRPVCIAVADFCAVSTESRISTTVAEAVTGPTIGSR